MPDKRNNLERSAAVFCAVFVFALVGYLAYRNEPFSDPNIVILIRIALAISVAVVANQVLGALHVRGKFGPITVRATGAFALGVISYFATPTVLPLDIEETIEINKLNAESRRLVSDGFCARAISISNRAILLDDTDWSSFNTLGVAYFACGKHKEAVAAWEKAQILTADLENLQGVKFNLSAGLIASGRYQDAVGVLSALWEDYDSRGDFNQSIAFNYGLSLLMVNQFETALAVLCAPENYGDFTEMAKIMIGYSALSTESFSEDERSDCIHFAGSIQLFEGEALQNVIRGQGQIPQQLKEIEPLLISLRN
ncbi:MULTISPECIES: tetratricopeptide repeat protein [unclassified Roseovarius]|uniref:tetratricopeptide repeat protein n=1 Tax=unclassified Roseovarius TaxID=2614913 RepID=UPI00273E3F61|nr:MULTISPECIES: tetratricopeptide repeat protein [unclassified Roseovarius]